MHAGKVCGAAVIVAPAAGERVPSASPVHPPVKREGPGPPFAGASVKKMESSHEAVEHTQARTNSWAHGTTAARRWNMMPAAVVVSEQQDPATADADGKASTGPAATVQPPRLSARATDVWPVQQRLQVACYRL